MILSAQALDAAWNRYIDMLAAERAAFGEVVAAVVAANREELIAAASHYRHITAETARAAQAIRGAQADLLTVLSLRTSELWERVGALEALAGISRPEADHGE